MTIPVGVEGKVSNSGYPEHTVRVEDDAEATGGFLIHEAWRDPSWPNGQGAYDNWVEDEAALAAYFAQAGWQVEWERAPDPAPASGLAPAGADFHDATLLPVHLPTIACARAVRDGGIDAMAALDAALHGAIQGLSAEQALAVKRAFGRVMGEIVCELIRPSTRAFPELEPDDATWAAVARARAAQRCVQLGGDASPRTRAPNDD